MPDLEDRIAALEAQASADKTDFDAITGRLTALENTVQAISDGLKNLAPEAAASVVADVADIKIKTDDFYKRVFGDTLFPATAPAAGG